MTQLDIYNLALLHLGVSDLLASTPDGSKASIVLTQVWPLARSYALKDYFPRFARRTAALVENADATVPTNWGHVFTLPTDCLQAHGAVVEGARVVNLAAKVPFELGTQMLGSPTPVATRLLYTDEEAFELEYTADVTDVAQFDPMFCSALGFLLAAWSATAMGKGDTGPALFEAYTRAASRAAATDMNQGFDHEAESSWITGRY